MNATELNRLRWRCRRGLLENDLILARFLDARASTMTPDDLTELNRLLALPDNELFDLITGRLEPRDAGMSPVLAALRAA